MGFHLKFFITRPSGPSIFSYYDIFVSPSVFHKQKERGREGHNRKGDETSINFLTGPPFQEWNEHKKKIPRDRDS